MTKLFSILIIAGLFISGCAQRAVLKETEQPKPKEQTSVTEKKQTQEKQADQKAPQEIVSTKEVSNTQPVDSLSLINALQAKIKDIHFDFDKYFISNAQQPILKQVADTLVKNGKLKVTIEGNCDERGTSEYNLALGDRRAKAAKDYLISLGIPSGRMDTISYGEESRSALKAMKHVGPKTGEIILYWRRIKTESRR